MKKNKIHIWKYETLYPIKLYVVCTEDLKGLFENFACIDEDESFDTNWREDAAFVEYNIYDKTTNEKVILVAFRDFKQMTFGTIVHESNHVAQRMWQQIGEKTIGIEADSYLIEWVANCINDTRLEIEKLNKKNKKK